MIRTIKHYYTRLNQIFSKKIIKVSKNPRPSSFPYISGDSFRSLANHIYEAGKELKFDPLKINLGDIVFVQSEMLDTFWENVHPKIKSKYILISHNGDKNITEKYKTYIDEKIIHWFAQNVIILHKKITPIPIGLENLSFYNNGITKYFNKYKKINIEKKNRILFGFTTQNNPKKRGPALASLEKNILANRIIKVFNSKEYLKELIKYKFVASPEGNGIDCIRTWEAVYLKTVPIVKRSILTEYFYNLGAPFWIINNWNELNNLTEHDLNEKYDSLKNRFNTKIIHMNYWLKKINLK